MISWCVVYACVVEYNLILSTRVVVNLVCDFASISDFKLVILSLLTDNIQIKSWISVNLQRYFNSMR